MAGPNNSSSHEGAARRGAGSNTSPSFTSNKQRPTQGSQRAANTRGFDPFGWGKPSTTPEPFRSSRRNHPILSLLKDSVPDTDPPLKSPTRYRTPGLPVSNTLWRSHIQHASYSSPNPAGNSEEDKESSTGNRSIQSTASFETDPFIAPPTIGSSWKPEIRNRLPHLAALQHPIFGPSLRSRNPFVQPNQLSHGGFAPVHPRTIPSQQMSTASGGHSAKNMDKPSNRGITKPFSMAGGEPMQFAKYPKASRRASEWKEKQKREAEEQRHSDRHKSAPLSFGPTNLSPYGGYVGQGYRFLHTDPSSVRLSNSMPIPGYLHSPGFGPLIHQPTPGILQQPPAVGYYVHNPINPSPQVFKPSISPPGLSHSSFGNSRSRQPAPPRQASHNVRQHAPPPSQVFNGSPIVGIQPLSSPRRPVTLRAPGQQPHSTLSPSAPSYYPGVGLVQFPDQLRGSTLEAQRREGDRNAGGNMRMEDGKKRRDGLE